MERLKTASRGKRENMLIGSERVGFSATKPKAFQRGLAFEYLGVLNVAKELKCEVEMSDKLVRARGEFDRMRGHKDLPKLTRHAKACSLDFIRKVSGLKGPVRMIPDSSGRGREVCDFEVGRGDGAFVGVSCKWNNKELKHHRLTEETDVIQQIFSGFSTSEACKKDIKRMFRRVRDEIEDEPSQTWAGFDGRVEVLKSIVGAVAKNADRVRKEGNDEAHSLINLIFGKRDHFVFLGGKKHPHMAFYNPSGSLALGLISTTWVPERIKSIEQYGKLGRGIRIKFFPKTDSPTDEEGLCLLLRLHQASKRLAPSLKWGARWEGSLFGFMDFCVLDDSPNQQ